MRESLAAAVRRNLAILRGEERGKYFVLGVEILDLRVPADVLPLKIPKTPGKEGRPGRVLFADEFLGERIDPKKWEYGSDVRQVDGEMRILRLVTDRGLGARTSPIRIDPTRPLRISRRAKVYAANDFFDGSMDVRITGYPEKRFGISYANYHYRGAGETITVGFSLFRHDSNSHRFIDRKTDASPLIPPVWGRWFEERLIYDPRTGDVRYQIDGRERLSYNVGPLPPNASSITLTFSTWGWYTGHYQHMDWIRVEQ